VNRARAFGHRHPLVIAFLLVSTMLLVAALVIKSGYERLQQRNEDLQQQVVGTATCPERAASRAAVRMLITEIVKGYPLARQQSIINQMNRGLPPISCN
jgi:hypothetical protein